MPIPDQRCYEHSQLILFAGYPSVPDHPAIIENHPFYGLEYACTVLSYAWVWSRIARKLSSGPHGTQKAYRSSASAHQPIGYHDRIVQQAL